MHARTVCLPRGFPDDEHALVEMLAEAIGEDGALGTAHPLARSLVDLTRFRQVQFVVLNDRFQQPAAQLLILERLQRYENKARVSIRRLIEVHDRRKAAHPGSIEEP